ncbi:hypothetical protein AYK26_03365 [Euryarchaeota archaeon SM23-78]|nr:MAG: hypothetical protein AYK26_03365 [Euryarchaeota archaeon SM23-78]MBW3000803.1 hypothetical protein [Candidatus Woesearchaeota archaeon]
MEDVTGVIVKDVLAKKELRNLNQEFVKEKVRKYVGTHKEIREKIKKEAYVRLRRSKEYKALIKNIRAELREIYGVFILKGYDKLPKLLDELKKNPSLENHNKILALHKSTKERLPYYLVVYKKIFEIIGTPKRIIDLACGLNPFSYPYLGCKPEYIACDLAEKDLEFIKEYFEIIGIKGQIKKIDLIKSNLFEIEGVIKKDDLVLLLKTLDSLETVKRNVSERILKNIKAKDIVVSFSTKSIGGKKAIHKDRRAWFEKLVKKIGFKIKVFEIPGESFYVLTK